MGSALAMKRVTVRLAFPPIESPKFREIAGYACEVLGVPMVVHRSIWTLNDTPSGAYWSVSDPVTGRSLCDGRLEPCRSRAAAVKRAGEIAKEQGGAGALTAKITQVHTQKAAA